MINTNALEKKWVLYKIKVYLPYAITSTSLTLIGLILYVFLSSNSQEIQSVKVETNTTKEPLIKEKTIIKKETIIKEIPKEELEKVVKQFVSKEIDKNIHIQREPSVILKPSLGFLHNIQKNNFEESSVAKKSEAISSSSKPIIITEQKVKLEVPKALQAPKTQVNREPNHITITKQDSHHDIKDVIKRFEKNRSPALSLFIAKKYYELGVYTKSYNYALATNEIDNDIEESWLIFAKSLVKLNEKEMAIKMLKKYIDHSSSYRAITLLDEINSGKFK